MSPHWKRSASDVNPSSFLCHLGHRLWSRLDPLRFIRNPSLAKSQSSSQLFGSTNSTPNVFAIHADLKNIPPLPISSRTLLQMVATITGLAQHIPKCGFAVWKESRAKCTFYKFSTVCLSWGPLYVSSDHTAHETNPPPSAFL